MAAGRKVGKMIADAIRWHPEVRHLKELTKFTQEIRAEYERAKRIVYFLTLKDGATSFLKRKGQMYRSRGDL